MSCFFDKIDKCIVFLKLWNILKMITKKVQSYVKLQIIAGSATPSPPVGPALGQQGVNIIEFCKEFNASTANLEKGLLIPVIVTVYNDRSFSFITKTPPTSLLLKKAAGINSGSEKPNTINVGKISLDQIYDISKVKAIDMTGSSIESISRSIIGTARSMGLEIIK